MNIVRMKGQMGNQMFQYALYLSLNAAGRATLLDDNSHWEHREAHIKERMNLHYRRAPGGGGLKRFFFNKFEALNRLLGTSAYWRERTADFHPDVLTRRFCVLDGFWQSEKYFDDPGVCARLRRDFACGEGRFESPDFARWFERIDSPRSVSLHIRRGDYLWKGNISTFSGICTDEYYRNAVEYILKADPEAEFYVFSDDKAYVRDYFSEERFPGVRFVIVGGTDGQLSDMDEFYLMRYCHHHILANSTFSWWAAWLDDRPDSLILAPERWLADRDQKDIYTDRMIKIPIGPAEEDGAEG